MIRVLVADDSATARGLLAEILRAEPGITVVGEAHDGLSAVRLASELRPDLVTMDIHMPGIDGFEATREIMSTVPTPIVIVSSASDATGTATAMRALAAGALAVLEKPPGPADPRFPTLVRELVATVRAMAGVSVVRQMRSARPARSVRVADRRALVVAIAASTGGPLALSTVLRALPEDFAAPILLVQHIAHGFGRGFADWLAVETGVATRIVATGDRLEPRVAHLAPEDRHLGVTGSGRIALSDAPPIGGFRPAASHLFASAADAFGAGTAAVILTGMGEDGVTGLRRVREVGGIVIAQDEATSVVFGMPGAAVAAGVVDRVLPLPEIAAAVASLARPRATHGRSPR